MVKKKRETSSLLRKQLRDLKAGWKSFMAILIICTLAVMLFIGIDATWRAIDIDLEDQFSKSNMADLWVRGQLSDRTLRDIRAIPGVSAAQRRALSDFEGKDLPETPNITVITNDGEPEVCIPLLREGRLPAARGEALLGQRFAQAQGLKPGDSIALTMGESKLTLMITGLGNMPEYVVASDGDELAPSALKRGYAYVAQSTLDFIPYSEIALSIGRGTDLAAVKAAVSALVADYQTVVIERDDVFGIKMAMEQAQQVRAMGSVFPLVFFVIAALITWTTMNRLVESQRLQIGSLFALGYGRGELLRHYAGYGILTAIVGMALGLLGARFALAPIIMYFISTTYALPDAMPYLSPLVVGAIGLVMMTITGGAGMLSARAALALEPAALLRPKPPGMGKRVLIENIRWLWKRVPFSDKMILRNMFRSPARLLMGLIGAIGCSALMLSGFGLRDSVNHVLINHYTRTMHYDLRLSLAGETPPGYAKSIALRSGAEAYEEEMLTSAEVYEKGQWRLKQIYVLENGHDMIRLSDDQGGRVTLPDEGIALTRKAAKDYGVNLGGELLLRNPGGRTVAARVNIIVDLQLNQGVYLSRAAWQKLGLSPFVPTDVLLRGPDVDAHRALGMEGVDKVRTLDEERGSSSASLRVINIIVLLLVIFSGTLELVVFYNISQLNFSERIRELATLRVLGFNSAEMKKLVLRENMITTLIGLPFGLLLGVPLLDILLTYGLPNTIQFVSNISQFSWLYTVGITILFALVINLVLGAKFKSINMVEALKSVE